MASFGRESTAGPVPSRTGRWSEFTQLSRQVKQAGLLERRHGWYAAKIGLNLALEPPRVHRRLGSLSRAG